MKWFRNAEWLTKNRGAFVTYEEEYYMCPDCFEPILAEEWDDEELDKYICPICGLKWETK